MTTPSQAPAFSWKVLALGLVLILPLVIVLGLGFGKDPGEMDKVLEGRPAPAFELPRLLDGQLRSLDDFRGQPLVLNFWATWCVPCAQEHPVMLQGARQFADRAQFVGIVYQDSNEKVLAWLNRYGGQAYPTLIDVNAKAAIAYGVYGVPETYFINREGMIVYKHVGPISPGVLRHWVEEIL